ncbi:MAG: ABC transporter substrate-binding protein [Candidatus Thorarchaeota archaeon]
MRRSVRTTALLAIAVLIVTSSSGVQTASSNVESDYLVSGPYVDEVIYRVIRNQDQRILALQAGEIETDNSFFDPVYLPQLVADPDVSIFEAVRNGYGHFTINCRDAPLNESVLRRAFAYAFDKTAVTINAMDGFSQEHDSVVPYPNGWCVEDDFDTHYYTDQSAIGNALLDATGDFPIDSGTGYRTYRGVPFNISIEYSARTSDGSYKFPTFGVDALHRLDIDAAPGPSGYPEMFSKLDNHTDYDMMYYATNFYSDDVDWLAYEYWSDYADDYGQNPTNFVNATYDGWRDQLLYGTTYEEVYEAASEMQKILHYNVPRLVVYQNTYIQAYRNDQFTGHVEDLGRYISGPWTMRKIHKIDGTPGGNVPVAIGKEPDSFNIFVTNSAYSAAILSQLWPSLYKYGPDLTPWPDLAESMVTETHSDNAAVPDGHTRFTIDIVQNATWSDGVPLTAQDVAFSFTYAFESGMYGNPAAADLSDIVAAYAPTPYRAVFEFSTESYWHFSDFAFNYIIPYHIFNDTGGIGFEGWESWNPVFDSLQPNVNCGPFIFSDYEDGEYYTIERNPLFHYAAIPYEPITESNSTSTSTTSITTTSEQTNTSLEQEFNYPLAINSSIVGFAIVVTLYVPVLIIQKRRNLESI